MSLLLVQQPLLVVLIALSLVVFGAVYLLFMRPLSSRWGNARHNNASSLIRTIQEGIGGIREVKIFQITGFLADEFAKTRRSDSRVAQISESAALLPRSILESLAVLSLSVFVVFQTRQEDSLNDLIPVLGLFALAGFRLLPVAIGMVSRLQTLQTSRAVITSVAQGLQMKSSEYSVKGNELRINSFESLCLSDVSFSYAGEVDLVLKGASLCVHRGEFIGVIGESGSGKSTLIDLIVGLSRPTTGTVCLNDIDIQTILDQWLGMIGYVPQNVFLIDDSLGANIALGSTDKNRDFERVKSCVQLAGLSDLLNSLPAGLQTRLGERGARLSGGQVQRVGIARALYRNPQVLVLDEATSALDHETERGFLTVLEQLKSQLTIVFVTHRESALSYCDRVVMVKNGLISASEPGSEG